VDARGATDTAPPAAIARDSAITHDSTGAPEVVQDVQINEITGMPIQEPRADWLIVSSLIERDGRTAFAGHYIVHKRRLYLSLDTLVHRPGQSAPARFRIDSVAADSLLPGEDVAQTCTLDGKELEGQVLGVLFSSEGGVAIQPRLAWQFDLEAKRIKSVEAGRVRCEQEYASD
jgi:hypothetical protein